jgi:integrase
MAGRCARSGKPGHGSWYFSLDLESYTPGRRERIRRGGYATREDAAQALARVRVPGGDGCGAVTVGQWLTLWSESRIRLRANTTRSYRSLTEHYLIPHLGRIPLDELCHRDVKRMLLALILHGGTAGRTLSTESLQRVQSCLSTALRAAIREGLITVNVARQVRLPRSRRQDMVVWTHDRVEAWQSLGLRPRLAVWTVPQTAAFLDSIDEHRLYAAFHLMALRGLRRGESAGLRWMDIDLVNGVLFVHVQNQRRDGQIVMCPPKTTSSVRSIALDTTTIAALRRHRERQLRELRELRVPDSGYVFTDTRGRPVAAHYLGDLFRRLVKASGLPPVRLHDLRHGAASLALQAGADLKVTSDQLGHSSIVLTADTYISILPDLARTTAQKIAELILAHGTKVPGTRRARSAEPARAVIRSASVAQTR